MQDMNASPNERKKTSFPSVQTATPSPSIVKSSTDHTHLTPNVESSSPPNKRKKTAFALVQTVTPSPSIAQRSTDHSNLTSNVESPSPEDVSAATAALKPMHSIVPTSLMTYSGPRLYLQTVADGLFHLLWVQEVDGTEAFSYPITQALKQVNATAPKGPTTKANQTTRTASHTIQNDRDRDFARRSGIIAVVPRRDSKARNVARTRMSGGKTFKTQYFVLRLPSSSFDAKWSALKEVQKVSSSFFVLCTALTFLCLIYFQLLNAYNISKNRPANYSVPVDFDKTRPERQALDEYLTDVSIIQLLELVLIAMPTSSFYKSNRYLAQQCFSEPYPAVARDLLGYPDPTIPLGEGENNERVLAATDNNTLSRP